MSEASSQFELNPLGDAAVEIRWPTLDSYTAWNRSRAVSQRLQIKAPFGFVTQVTGFESLTVHYDPWQVESSLFCQDLRAIVNQVTTATIPSSQTVEIPICYDQEFAIDLADVARLCELSEEGVIALHLEATYQVRMIGFAPGFPYLSGLPERLIVPRLATPRGEVPAGSVAIASGQTGIYPHRSPGGWRIIGRTPLSLFDAHRDPPTRLGPGDTVRFSRIVRSEFEQLLGARR